MKAQLFIPAARVYSVTDNIPFHLQLSGSLPSLQVFLDPPSKENTVIGVNLVRQVVIETRYKTASQYILLARGKLSEIPPLASSPSEPQDSIHLDWEGEVRCSSDTSVGGFIAGNVSVKVSDLPEILVNSKFTLFNFVGLYCPRHKAS